MVLLALSDFEAKVDRSGGPDACHPWTAATNGHGYGRLGGDHDEQYAHRIAWVLAHYRDLPSGLHVNHLCHNRDLSCLGGVGLPASRVRVLVGTYNELPDCQATQGHDPGRGCVPERGASQNSYFRAGQYPIGAVDPSNPQRVVVTYGSYINRNSNPQTGCVPAGFSPFVIPIYHGAKDGGCNNDIISTSTDGARTFSGTTLTPRLMPVVTDSAGQAKTSQFWQNAGFSPNGTLAVTYYDRQYGSDETSGYSDITLSVSTDRTTFTQRRVTSSSMPPPTQFSGTFAGDYTGLAVTDQAAYPIWTDTRTVDEFLCPNTATLGTPESAPAQHPTPRSPTTRTSSPDRYH